ncbi:MAG: hypothetical protein R3A79_00725 [Nannocystaceae bacterium]
MACLRLLPALGLAALASACVIDNDLYVSPTSEVTSDDGTTTTMTTTATSVADVSTSGETTGETSAETTAETTSETTGSLCGNGMVDAGESCDDGAANGTPDSLCLTSCEPSACGDGVVSLGEDCDEGDANGTASSTCSSWCEPAVCGDGEITMGEECDSTDANISLHTYACTAECAKNSCGDGLLADAEMCEEALFPGECAQGCSFPMCGDNLIMFGEECDPPNGGDCAAICRYAPVIEPYGLPAKGDAIGDSGVLLGPTACSKFGIVGLHGDFDADEKVVSRAGAVCGVHSTQPLNYQYEVVHGDHTNDSKFGEPPMNSVPFTIKCPSNLVLTGVAATVGTYVEKIALLCSEVRGAHTGASWEVFIHPWSFGQMVGDTFTADDEIQVAACSDGKVVAKLGFYGDGEITKIAVDCVVLDAS